MRTLNNSMDPPTPYDEEDSPVRFKITLTDADGTVEGEYEITQDDIDARLGVPMVLEDMVRDIRVLAKQRGYLEE